ncbi:uncharacterized protein LOC130137593 [Syzygium oleosum]|uniref:uncharacterized protein LOC130137593 n=1 Tax=Syzygium oleosum TaxID=219896 RepID=UPI0024BA6941|nr:uncharacterized protein LOC130137593 [Syzygium oleosum]
MHFRYCLILCKLFFFSLFQFLKEEFLLRKCKTPLRITKQRCFVGLRSGSRKTKVCGTSLRIAKIRVFEGRISITEVQNSTSHNKIEVLCGTSLGFAQNRGLRHFAPDCENQSMTSRGSSNTLVDFPSKICPCPRGRLCMVKKVQKNPINQGRLYYASTCNIMLRNYGSIHRKISTEPSQELHQMKMKKWLS